MKPSKMFMVFLLAIATYGFAMQPEDVNAIKKIVNDYAEALNNHEGVGFADNFSDDATFINIYGMYLDGKKEIEERHEAIMKTLFKNSSVKITNIVLHEISPDHIIGIIEWKLTQDPKYVTNDTKDVNEGIFTQVFVKKDGKWLIKASQNTTKTSKGKIKQNPVSSLIEQGNL